MIDQRVSEGIKLNFYGRPAFTTTIPAQLVKKYKCKVVPIYIERINKVEFKVLNDNPRSTEYGEITKKYVHFLEQDILNAPSQWIWSHDRWK